MLFLPYYFFVDESVQWLLSKNRLADAERIVLKAAETNGKDLDTPIFTSGDENKNSDDSNKKKNACTDFMAMFGDIWNVISGKRFAYRSFYQ